MVLGGRRLCVGFLFSTMSAVTELGVSAAVYTFLWAAWRHGRFHRGLIVFALTYEVLVNISYMTYRLIVPSEGVEYSAGMGMFLAFHGLLSLVMFIGLVGLVIAAWRAHGKGLNLFRLHPSATAAFAVLWAVSVITGEVIYVVTYL